MARSIQNPLWEVVNARNGDETERLPITGGWLYRTVLQGNSETGPPSVAMTFVRAPTSRRLPPR